MSKDLLTPKEKAKELIKIFEPLVDKPKARQAGDFGDFKADYDFKMMPIKRCALILCDEMRSGSPDNEKEFWQQVKKEIQKL